VVDDILVKLDEVEEHVLKTQADVDRLMRDFSKPDRAKDILGGMPGGPTGLFDQIIKAITGTMPGGKAVAAGMAGGAVAGGIVMLTDALKQVFSNSKILTTVLGTIAQALGLLIDVILLPFLPILITGIIWLYQGIMLFYKLWNGIWSSKVVQGVGAALTDLGKILGKGIGGLLSIGVNFLGGAGNIVWEFLQWLWNLATSNGIIGMAFSFILGPFGLLLNWIYDVATGKNTGTLKLLLDVAGAAVGFLTWLWNTITSGGANLFVNLTQGARNTVSNAASTAGDWWSGVMSGGWLPHFDQGGVVPGTGPQLAVVHGGETVTPAGQSGGHTFIFPNYVGSKTELMKVVTDALRQNQYRYNV
jgi:hypothetical protein